MTTKNERAAFRKLQEYQRRSEAFEPDNSASGGHSTEWSGVTFALRDFRLACNIENVHEIIPIPGVTPVPGSKKWILGLANVRGNLMTLVDFGWYLHGERTKITPHTRLLAIGSQKSPVGLLVDEVFGQRHFLSSDAHEAKIPEDSSLKGLVQNEHRLGSESWQELDLEQLFNSREFLNGAAT